MTTSTASFVARPCGRSWRTRAPQSKRLNGVAYVESWRYTCLVFILLWYTTHTYNGTARPDPDKFDTGKGGVLEADSKPVGQARWTGYTHWSTVLECDKPSKSLRTASNALLRSHRSEFGHEMHRVDKRTELIKNKNGGRYNSSTRFRGSKRNTKNKSTDLSKARVAVDHAQAWRRKQQDDTSPFRDYSFLRRQFFFRWGFQSRAGAYSYHGAAPVVLTRPRWRTAGG